MTDWIAEGRRRARSRLQSLVSSAPSLTVPIKDSADQARGWKFLCETYSCIPDVEYPWDAAVVRAVREFCPDVMPIIVRTVWQSSRLEGEPRTMVLVRHGIARHVRDPICPVHHFDCQMPSTPIPGIRLRRPNYIELVWYDKDVRPWGCLARADAIHHIHNTILQQRNRFDIQYRSKRGGKRTYASAAAGIFKRLEGEYNIGFAAHTFDEFHDLIDTLASAFH